MAKNIDKFPDAASIAKLAMPGWQVLSISDKSPVRKVQGPTAPPPADRVMPDLRELQLKSGLAIDSAAITQSFEAHKLQIVELSSGNMRKIVGVQGGKVVWTQG